MNKKIPKILELYEDYLKSTIKLSNQIMFTLEDTKPWESKLGGCPYLEDIEQYPKGTDGGPMMFLAQINLPRCRLCRNSHMRDCFSFM